MSEFDEWINAEGRIIVLEADLRKAVTDRAKLIAVVKSAIEDTNGSNVQYLSKRFEDVLREVEGKE